MAIVVVGSGLLAGFGVIGSYRPEQFTQWQTIIRPAGGNGLSIEEIIDYDFGPSERHGLERSIPTDFGRPIELTATATDVPDQVSQRVDQDLVVRIGDPQITNKGMHRYHLKYVLPDAKLDEGVLAIDIFGRLRLPVESATATIDGFELFQPHCFHGAAGARATCEIRNPSPGVYTIELSEVPAGDFVTIDGRILDTVEPTGTDVLASPVEDGVGHWVLGGIVAGSAALVAAGIFWSFRRHGRNEVFGDTDAAAAFAGPVGANSDRHRMVTDAELASMSTTEFAPPSGLQPWEGAAVLSEHLHNSAPNYLSGLAANGVIELQPAGKNVSITAGPNFGQATAADRSHVEAILAVANPFVTGEPNSAAAEVFRQIDEDLVERLSRRHWWRHGGPGSKSRVMQIADLLVFFVVLGATVFSFGNGFRRTFGSPGAAVLFGVGLSAFVSVLSYRSLLPSRTAAGSAVALRVASFRRFLHHSEAQHVEWAWQNGVLREYSAWAVALGEAKAWSKALAATNVPAHTLDSSPILLHTYSSSVARGFSSPRSSSVGSTGGGFSGGGFAGGGGGGGGGGGW